VGVLLRQPHGFEGVLPLLIHGNALDCSIAGKVRDLQLLRQSKSQEAAVVDRRLIDAKARHNQNQISDKDLREAERALEDARKQIPEARELEVSEREVVFVDQGLREFFTSRFDSDFGPALKAEFEHAHASVNAALEAVTNAVTARNESERRYSLALRVMGRDNRLPNCHRTSLT
jgi:hypothetical protein